MDKKEEFKNFARLHPELLDYIKNKEMSWQSFYEIYDIYGSDEKAWSKYFRAFGVSKSFSMAAIACSISSFALSDCPSLGLSDTWWRNSATVIQ